MTRIIVDSTCDLDLEAVENYNLSMVPLSVRFEDEEYMDKIDISNEEFYEKLIASREKVPHTSQPSPDSFRKVFETLEGEDAVYMAVSSKISGTIQSAYTAKMDLGIDNLHILDTRQVSFGEALLVNLAVKMRDEGKNAEEIYAEIMAISGKIKFYAAIDTLKYLVYGGRISKVSGKIGKLMSITPIVEFRDGILEQAGKTRGKKLAYRRILQNVVEDIDTDYPVCFGHSHAKKGLDSFKEYVLSEVTPKEVMEVGIGPVVGTYSGPGTVGIAYISK